MATRGYFPSSGAPDVSPAVSSAWEREASTFFRAKLPIGSHSNTTRTSFQADHGSESSDDACFAQFVSDPLDVNQTITGTLSIVCGGRENAGTDNLFLAVIVRVVSNDGTTVRGTLLTQTTESGGTEFGTTERTRIWSGLSLSSVGAISSDRIVVEVGSHGNTPAAGANLKLWFGDPTADADSALTSGLAATNVHWVELSQTLTFGTPQTLTPSAATTPQVPPSVSLAFGTATLTPTPAGVSLHDLPSGDPPGPGNPPEIALAFGTATFTPSAASSPLVAPSPTLALELVLTPSAASSPLVAPSPTLALELVLTPSAASSQIAVPSAALVLELVLTPTPASTPLVAPAVARVLELMPTAAATVLEAPAATRALLLPADASSSPLVAPAVTLELLLELLLSRPPRTRLSALWVELRLELNLTPDPAVVVIGPPAFLASAPLTLTPDAAGATLAVLDPTVTLELVLTPSPAQAVLEAPAIARHLLVEPDPLEFPIAFGAPPVELLLDLTLTPNFAAVLLDNSRHSDQIDTVELPPEVVILRVFVVAILEQDVPGTALQAPAVSLAFGLVLPATPASSPLVAPTVQVTLGLELPATPASSPLVAPAVTLGLELVLAAQAAGSPLVAPTVQVVSGLGLAPGPAETPILAPAVTISTDSPAISLTPPPARARMVLPTVTVRLWIPTGVPIEDVGLYVAQELELDRFPPASPGRPRIARTLVLDRFPAQTSPGY